MCSVYPCTASTTTTAAASYNVQQTQSHSFRIFFVVGSFRRLFVCVRGGGIRLSRFFVFRCGVISRALFDFFVFVSLACFAVRAAAAVACFSFDKCLIYTRTCSPFSLPIPLPLSLAAVSSPRSHPASRACHLPRTVSGSLPLLLRFASLLFYCVRIDSAPRSVVSRQRLPKRKITLIMWPLSLAVAVAVECCFGD